ERGGLRYARALVRVASNCARRGSGPISSCLDGGLGVGTPALLRARWEAKVADACATTDLGPELGYFTTCRGGPAACEATPGGLPCLTCRVEQHVRTAMTALYADAPPSAACHTAVGRLGVRALDRLLRDLGFCLRRSDAVSIAVCFTEGGIGERLDAAMAAWRDDAVAACGTIDPLTSFGYPSLCSGVPPEPINSCRYSAPPCTLPAAGALSGTGPDDDLLDCLGCRVEETGLAIARDLFGANLCCTDEGCGFVRTRTSCRRSNGTPVYFENQPFSIVASSQPYGA